MPPQPDTWATFFQGAFWPALIAGIAALWTSAGLACKWLREFIDHQQAAADASQERFLNHLIEKEKLTREDTIRDRAVWTEAVSQIVLELRKHNETVAGANTLLLAQNEKLGRLEHILLQSGREGER